MLLHNCSTLKDYTRSNFFLFHLFTTVPFRGREGQGNEAGKVRGTHRQKKIPIIRSRSSRPRDTTTQTLAMPILFFLRFFNPSISVPFRDDYASISFALPLVLFFIQFRQFPIAISRWKIIVRKKKSV